MQRRAAAFDDTAAHLDLNALTPGAASGDLALQFGQLGGAWRGLVMAAQPVAQHVGLARAAERRAELFNDVGLPGTSFSAR